MIIVPSLLGGLGNQLFEVAAAYAYAVDHGATLTLAKNWAIDNKHSRQDYFDTVFSRFPRVRTVMPDGIYQEQPRNCTRYVPMPDYLGKGSAHVFHGFFQNERYFAKHKRSFLDMLRLPEVPEMPDGACFLHVRRTDYLAIPLHNVDLSSYYPRAIEYVRKQRLGTRFVVFSDDIEWCKKEPWIASLNPDFNEDPDEVRALCSMAACEVGGICANSTYSWWGAYMNPSPDKCVTFPDTWFTDPEYAHEIAFEGSTLISCTQ
jgi:hypothetical protein